MCEMTIETHGAQIFEGSLSPSQLRDFESVLADQPNDQAGVRLSGVSALRPWLDAGGVIGRIPASIMGRECFPVRAVLFGKSAGQNWSLGWHQDRTIAVRQRVETRGFGPWSIKRGMIHVEPPFELLERMLTVRVHVDPVTATNAPLMIAPGSDKLGRVPVAEIARVVEQCGVVFCRLYATILHASGAALE
jgi:hypothetical protein